MVPNRKCVNDMYMPCIGSSVFKHEPSAEVAKLPLHIGWCAVELLLNQQLHFAGSLVSGSS